MFIRIFIMEITLLFSVASKKYNDNLIFFKCSWSFTTLSFLLEL